MRTSDSSDNPYAEPANLSAPCEQTRQAGWRYVVLPILVLSTAACGFVVLVSIEEIITMPPQAYGQHTHRFMWGYARTAVSALLMMVASIVAIRRIVKRQPHSGRLAAIVIFGLLIYIGGMILR